MTNELAELIAEARNLVAKSQRLQRESESVRRTSRELCDQSLEILCRWNNKAGWELVAPFSHCREGFEHVYVFKRPK